MKRTDIALFAATLLAGVLQSAAARADAVVYAVPPPRDDDRPVVATDEPCCEPRFGERESLDLRRSAARFELGPGLLTTGTGVGYGIGTGLAFGDGAFGLRLGAGWFKGEERASTPAATGELFQHYTIETTLDLNKYGRIHPIVAMGIAIGHVSHAAEGGTFGAGTARIGLEYTMNIDRTDVRFGIGAMGAMVGPRSGELRALGGYGVLDAKWVIGF